MDKVTVREPAEVETRWSAVSPKGPGDTKLSVGQITQVNGVWFRVYKITRKDLVFRRLNEKDTKRAELKQLLINSETLPGTMGGVADGHRATITGATQDHKGGRPDAI